MLPKHITDKVNAYSELGTGQTILLRGRGNQNEESKLTKPESLMQHRFR